MTGAEPAGSAAAGSVPISGDASGCRVSLRSDRSMRLLFPAIILTRIEAGRAWRLQGTHQRSSTFAAAGCTPCKKHA